MARRPATPPTPARTCASATWSELTRTVFGGDMSVAEVWDHLQSDEFTTAPDDAVGRSAPVWGGSIGYERFRDVRDFVRQLASADVERLIDVRELPISRRRGYAKTALREALQAAGIEYVHMRALGNPKKYRDLYKSGKADQGRGLYQRFLLTEQREALVALKDVLEEKRSALMCVEDDQSVCHRDVIIGSLQQELGVRREVAALAEQ